MNTKIKDMGINKILLDVDNNGYITFGSEKVFFNREKANSKVEFFQDNNDNIWESSLYSLDDVIKLSDSMINCKWCINSKLCFNCFCLCRCIDCIDTTHSNDSISCLNSSNLSHCKNLDCKTHVSNLVGSLNDDINHVDNDVFFLSDDICYDVSNLNSNDIVYQFVTEEYQRITYDDIEIEKENIIEEYKASDEYDQDQDELSRLRREGYSETPLDFEYAYENWYEWEYLKDQEKLLDERVFLQFGEPEYLYLKNLALSVGY